MEDKKKSAVEKIAESEPGHRNDVVRCEKCGEFYSATYDRCPFCDDAPVQENGNWLSKKVSTKNPVQLLSYAIIGLLIVLVLFVAVTKIGPMFSKDKKPGATSSMLNSSITAVSLDKSEIVLTANETYQMLAVVEPEGIEEPIFWFCDKPELLTVDENGLLTNTNVTGAQEKAIVTATCGDKSATCVVTLESGVPQIVDPEPTPQPEPQPQPEPAPQPEPQPEPPKKVAHVGSKGKITAEGGLAVRAEPNKDSKQLATSPEGKVIEIKEITGNGWYKIDWSGGKGDMGYISAKYVEILD